MLSRLAPSTLAMGARFAQRRTLATFGAPRAATRINRTTGLRRFSEQPNVSKADTSVPTTIKFQQGAKKTISYTMQAALAVAAIGGFGYLAYMLMPTQMSPFTVFSETVEVVREHPEVVARLGSPIKAYGMQRGVREGRRNNIESDHYTDLFGVERLRIKLNLEGPRGKAVVYSEVEKGAPKGHFSYVLFEPKVRGHHEVLALIENRNEPTTEELQKAVVDKLNKYGFTLYGKTNCAWTKRQKEEFGAYAASLQYVDCDVNGTERCKSLPGTPTFANEAEDLPGFHSLDKLVTMAKQLS